MSRQIDVNKQLTEDEVKYLEDRDWQHVLDLNAMLLMGGGADEGRVEEAELQAGTSENGESDGSPSTPTDGQEAGADATGESDSGSDE